ncbi:Rho GTPase activation protein [Nadsonia fulvescens var. elongata DSM 6958]|uniref:Rho GTPase activation protein n=1 Tax=Nadsonia fulvescens var. elongata DSM 6958 TaxID=857566 RepID=A0A1E3PEI1_9ASCO|nr:Rho GTPase activation protein [Nadsonia fulvescens var. elongata DSM 6958]
MMTTYTRRGPGQTYIHAALIDNLSIIIDSQENLEINPLEVYEEIHANDGTPTKSYDAIYEMLACDREVNGCIHDRAQRLVDITSDILDGIMTTMDKVPYGIRWICKQIRLLARRKYPEVSNAAICSLIGAFFFLRFINPAIVTPQTYMLIDKVPPATTRRTLTLIAKVLQNLANKPTYTKETYMNIPVLTEFIERRKTSINEFLNELCEVTDFYETLEMDQYIALSKRDIDIGITLNEILGMHGLLHKYHDQMKQSETDRTTKALETTLPMNTSVSTQLKTSYPNTSPNHGLFNISHLSLLLEELGPPPALVPRQNNANMSLPLFSKWASPLSEETLDPSNAFLPSAVPFLSTLARPDVVFMELKTLMINIIRSYPSNHSILKRPLDLNFIANHAASSADINLVKRGIKAIDLLTELVLMTETSLTSSEDPALLVDEIEYELTQLGSLLHTLEEESVSLEKVLHVIGEHNEYLHSQLETYRSYLRNVRNGGNQQGQPSLQQRYIDEAVTNQKKLHYTKLPKLNIFSSSSSSAQPEIKIPSNAPYLSRGEGEAYDSNDNSPGGNSTAEDYISLYTSNLPNQNTVINNGTNKGTSKKYTLTQLSTLGIVVWHRFPISRVPAIHNHSELALTKDQTSHNKTPEVTTPTTPVNQAASSNLFMYIRRPTSTSFLISVHFKNRPEPLLNVDFRLDDLLELKDTGVEVVDLVCFGLGVRALIATVTKMGKKK